jgi:hypothetical protein
MSKPNPARQPGDEKPRPEAAKFPPFADTDLPMLIARNTAALMAINSTLERFTKVHRDLIDALIGDREKIAKDLGDVITPLEMLLSDHLEMIRDTPTFIKMAIQDSINGRSPLLDRIPAEPGPAMKIAANRVDPSVALFDDTPPKRRKSDGPPNRAEPHDD